MIDEIFLLPQAAVDAVKSRKPKGRLMAPPPPSAAIVEEGSGDESSSSGSR